MSTVGAGEEITQEDGQKGVKMFWNTDVLLRVDTPLLKIEMIVANNFYLNLDHCHNKVL